MKKKNLLQCFEPRLDWLSVIGDTPHIDRERDEIKITQTMQEWGFIKLKDKTRMTYRSEVWGIEVSFMLKRKTSLSYIKLEYQGQYFATTPEICNLNIKTFIEKCWSEFGVLTPPKATRIDIAIDIVNSTVKEIIPDISNPKYELITNTKKENKPKLTKFYSDENNINSETGMSIYNSRYQMVVYNRIEKLTQYSKKDNKQNYCKYYKELYSGIEKVHRLEIRLHKELCNLFNIQYFSNNHKIEAIIPECLAFFNKHHKFINTKNKKPITHLENLFAKDKYKSIKQILSDKTITQSDIYTTAKYYNIKPSINYIANFFVANRKTTINDIIEFVEMIISAINIQKENHIIKLQNERKTFELFHFNYPNQKQIAEDFVKRSIELRTIRTEQQIEISSEQLQLLTFIKSKE